MPKREANAYFHGVDPALIRRAHSDVTDADVIAAMAHERQLHGRTAA